MFVDLQGAVCVGAPEGVGSVDGGRGQSLRHGHPHVDTGQVHDDRLREVDRTETWGEWLPSCNTPLSTIWCCTHHGAAVGVGVEVAAEGNNYPSIQHVSGPRLRQPEHTHTQLSDSSQL